MEETDKQQQMQVAVPYATKQMFLSSIVDMLSNYNWPNGAIKCINPNNTKLIFLYGNRIKVNVEGDYTAKVDGEYLIAINDQKATIPNGMMYNGTIPKTPYEFILINENNSTPEWAKKYCQLCFECKSFQPISYVEQAGGIKVGDNSDKSLQSWVKYGDLIIRDFSYQLANQLSKHSLTAYLALNVLPKDVIMNASSLLNDNNFPSRDVVAHTQYYETEAPSPVLVPFYLLEFSFEGKEYHISMAADKNYAQHIKGQIPPVKIKETEIIKPLQIVEKEMPEKYKQVKMVKWCWVLAIVLFLIANFKIAFIYLIAWYICYQIIKKPINKRVNEIVQQIMDKNKEKAEMLKKQLLG